MSVLDAIIASRLGVCAPFAPPPFVCFAVRDEPVVKTIVVKKVEAVEVEPPCGTESLVRRLCRKCVGKRATIVAECNGKTACLRVFLADVGRDFIEVHLPGDGDTPVFIPLKNVCAIQCNTASGTICDFFTGDPISAAAE